MELASKSAWLNGKASGHESKGKPKVCGSRLKVSIEIKRIQVGMLGEQGWKQIDLRNKLTCNIYVAGQFVP